MAEQSRAAEGAPSALAPARALQERQLTRPPKHWLRPWVVLVVLTTALIAVLAWAGVRALVSGPPELAYPDGPTAPSFATVLATDQAEDSDDPVRARLVVVDIGARPVDDLLEFYRTTYRSSAGWKSFAPPAGHDLCLVNSTTGGDTENIEVLEYHGSRVLMATGRYLVMISRMQEAEGDGCGDALAWVASDIN